MEKILVAYATLSGSTADVAQAMGEELQKGGWHVDVLPLEKINSLDSYAAIVLGAPMIMGWHRAALRFLKRNRQTLSRIPLAIFIMAMSLTQTSETSMAGVPIYIDERLSKPPQTEGRPNLRERYASVSNYLRPILNAAPSVRPISVGFFGGRLVYYRLKPWNLLFVLLIVQAQPGDRRNWAAIREWAASLPAAIKEAQRE